MRISILQEYAFIDYCRFWWIFKQKWKSNKYDSNRKALSLEPPTLMRPRSSLRDQCKDVWLYRKSHETLLGKLYTDPKEHKVIGTLLADPEANAVNFFVQPRQKNKRKNLNLQQSSLKISSKCSQPLNNKRNHATRL